MTKAEMAAKLAAKCDLSQAKAADIIDCIFSTKPGEGIIAIELDADREEQENDPDLGGAGDQIDVLYEAERIGPDEYAGEQEASFRSNRGDCV